ncbi:conserved hypothetical protein [Culex quinquefasciatus]|uniref:Uncharacterized protein n=1 Tax=Culex quinquefasciatus TaxID=7176 RepID=B0X5G5_CULQU|nr:conserved hypothetical protein [Culex quinquefasciatus]|eukprot:XP_001864887.1 conserved hypothetical protein [Culex quinquefasciatus]
MTSNINKFKRSCKEFVRQRPFELKGTTMEL